MLLEVLPGLSLLPRMPRVDPCQLQVLLHIPCTPGHSLVVLLHQNTAQSSVPGLVWTLCSWVSMRIWWLVCAEPGFTPRWTRGKPGLSQLLLSLLTPLVHKHGGNRDFGQGQAALRLGRCCTTSLFPHFHRLRESREALGWKGPHSPSRATPCHAQGHFP